MKINQNACYFYLAAFILSLSSSIAANHLPLELAWDPNPEEAIVEYEIRYGVSSGEYSTRMSAGTNTRIGIPGLQSGQCYYFVVAARSEQGLWSGNSNEAVFRYDQRVESVGHDNNLSDIAPDLDADVPQAAAESKRVKVTAQRGSQARTSLTTHVSGGRKYLAMILHDPTDPVVLAGRVEVSSDLINWFSGEGHTVLISANRRIVRIRDLTPLGPGVKRYIRLRPPSD